MKLSNLKNQFLNNLTEFYLTGNYNVLKRNWPLIEKAEVENNDLYLSERLDAITEEIWNATDVKFGENVPEGEHGVFSNLAFERLECIFSEDEIRGMDDEIEELYEKYLNGDE